MIGKLLGNAGARREAVRALQFVSVSVVSALSNIAYVTLVSRFSMIPFWFVSLSSTEFSMVVNFALNDRITFHTLARERAWYVRLLRFQAAALAGNILTALLSTILHDQAGLAPVYAQSVAIAIAFFFNFAMHRFWTFRGAADPYPGAGESTVRIHVPRAYDPGVSIVVPARNEAESMRPLLLRLCDALSTLPMPYEILLIDDRSTDGTGKTAAQVISENHIPAHVLMKRGRPGKSYALLEGFAAAKYSLLAMIDGDLELPPESLPPMVAQLEHYDLVIGKRVGYGLNNSLRAKLSALYSAVIVRAFLGLRCETQTGIKAFWHSTFDSIEVHPGPWGFDLEFVAKATANHLRIGEHEVPFQKRQAGTTKVNAIAVAAELLRSAVRIKVDIVRTSRAQERARRSVTPSDQLAPSPRVRVKTASLLALRFTAEWALPYVVLLAFIWRLMGTSFFSTTQFIGLPGDANQYMWFIGWIWHALLHGSSPFTSHAFGYPDAISIMDFTSVPWLGLLFGWLYYFMSIQLVYNTIFVVNYLFIFFFGKLILRELGLTRVGSSIGGLLFCLLPYLTAQELGHLNLDFLAPNLLICYLVVRIMRSERRPGFSTGLLLGLALFMSFYTFLETFATLMLFLGILLVCGLILAPQQTLDRVRRALRTDFLVGVIAPLMLVIPGALNFLHGQTGGNLDFTFVANYYVNDLLSFAVPSEVFALHNYATVTTVYQFTGNASEWDGYLSIPFTLLFVVQSVLQWGDKRIRMFAVTAAAFLIFSLGPHLHIDGIATNVALPWSLMMHVPFIKSALPARLALYTEALGIVIIMVGADKAFKELHLSSLNSLISLRRPTIAGVAANVSALLLVAACWFPITPWPSASLPRAATILTQDDVTDRYLGTQPTLILYDSDLNGFATVMGILAASRSYNLVVSDVYGHDMAQTPSYKINAALVSGADPSAFGSALRQYLPQIGVQRIMFVSIDDQPMAAPQVTQVTSYLGQPIYNNDGLVVVWSGLSAETTNRCRNPADTC